MGHGDTSQEVSRKSGVPGEINYLAFAAIPVSIYVLSMAIFEQGDFGSMALESKLASIVHASRDASGQVVFSEGRAGFSGCPCLAVLRSGRKRHGDEPNGAEKIAHF